MRVRRIGSEPIISPKTDPSIGTNIQGPSLIRVPDWVSNPLGRYYLYFADHKGSYIRLAFADAVAGPWVVHPPGALQLADSGFLTEPPEASDEEIAALGAFYDDLFGPGSFAHALASDATTPHIASPDAHVDSARQQIVLYLHGLDSLGTQVSRAATSSNGIRFESRPEILGAPYLRAFAYDGWIYALTMPGRFSRSRDGLSDFQSGPTLFERDMRHSAVLVRGETLNVLWTRVGDAPERILHSTVDLTGDWSDWEDTEGVEVLRPELAWEGAEAPVEPSVRSVAPGHVNQLRDPAIFVEDGRAYLLYAGAGESAIGLAEIEF